MSQPNLNRWEAVEGCGKSLTITQLEAKLEAIRAVHGDIPVLLRNYLEENTLAPVTDLQLDHGQVVCESQDMPASETTG
jgi:hypothetical protein